MSISSGAISTKAALSFAPFLRLRTFKFFASNLLCRARRLSLAPSSFCFFHCLPVHGPRENTAAAVDSCTLARKNSHGRVKRRDDQHRFAKRFPRHDAAGFSRGILGSALRSTLVSSESGFRFDGHTTRVPCLRLETERHEHLSASNARR